MSPIAIEAFHLVLFWCIYHLLGSFGEEKEARLGACFDRIQKEGLSPGTETPNWQLWIPDD